MNNGLDNDITERYYIVVLDYHVHDKLHFRPFDCVYLVINYVIMESDFQCKRYFKKACNDDLLLASGYILSVMQVIC